MRTIQITSEKPSIQMQNTTDSFPKEITPISTTPPTVKTRVSRLLRYQWWKYVFDRVFALFALVILSPLLALIAIVIKLDSKGDAIYRRKQVAENGRIFTAYKFRTMYTNNSDYEYKAYLVRYITEDAPYKIDQNGQAIYKVVEDPRVTRFGSILRETNLDELPQLINMLKGEMSLIGPRPDIPFAVKMYKDWHWERLSVKPGITGLWQVQRRKQLSFDDMVHLDIDYIRRQSPLLDVKIALLTLVVFLRKDGS